MCTVFGRKNKTHMNYFLVQTNLIWSEWQDLNLRPLPPQRVSKLELVASTGGYKWPICQYNLAFSCVFNRFSKRETDSKTIQKAFCVAGCVTNQLKLRSRESCIFKTQINQSQAQRRNPSFLFIQFGWKRTNLVV